MTRIAMPHRTRLGTLAAAAVAAMLLPATTPVLASTFGSLANFDVVNDTGKPAYGFEIEIEDINYDHPGTISSVFGYDRVFSFISPDPGAVVRFGKPTIDYIAGFGARITYGGTVGAEFTPSAPYATNGESCWPGANPSWKTTSCDHYGVSTYGAPAKTTYSWIVDMGGGSLAKQMVGVPVVNFQFTPPPPPPPGKPPAPPAQVVAAVAPLDLGLGGGDPVLRNKGNAFWVKMVKTTVGDNVELNDLLAGDHQGARPEIAGLETEIEIEWQVLQPGFVDEVTKSVDMNGDPAAVWKFEFYKYLGRFDGEGLVDPLKSQEPVGNTLNEFVGDFVGQQIAGFNANEVAPIPEPETWALMLAGLAVLGRLARRRR